MWESDFFSVTSSGYCQEIEVKISIADYRADFKKQEKHRALLQRYNGGNGMATIKGSTCYDVDYYEKEYEFDKKGRRQILEGSDKYGRVIYKTRRGELKNKKSYSYKHLDYTKATPLYSKVRYRYIKTPNKFYYICPTDLIPIKEVPNYAGLIYIDNKGHTTTIKRAPFLHKENIMEPGKENLMKILLDKFYWLSRK